MKEAIFQQAGQDQGVYTQNPHKEKELKQGSFHQQWKLRRKHQAMRNVM